jgi:hypothetical protein
MPSHTLQKSGGRRAILSEHLTRIEASEDRARGRRPSSRILSIITARKPKNPESGNQGCTSPLGSHAQRAGLGHKRERTEYEGHREGMGDLPYFSVTDRD